MDKEPKNTGNERDLLNHDNVTNRDEFRKADKTGTNSPDRKQDEDDLDNTNKYLAMEQPGVSYTHNHNPVANSDDLNPNEQNGSDEWNEEGGNSEYSDAFNQDDYILNDNIDLDEDQNQSISSDDEDFEETNERY